MMRLDGLSPEWVSPPGGWGHGVSWQCPRHAEHRLTIMFANPADGGQATWPGPYYMRIGTSFSTLTVTARLELGVCFRGWLVDGELLEGEAG
jgi:hypothetical protein